MAGLWGVALRARRVVVLRRRRGPPGRSRRRRRVVVLLGRRLAAGAGPQAIAVRLILDGHGRRQLQDPPKRIADA